MKRIKLLAALSLAMIAQIASANIAFSDAFPIKLANGLPKGWAAVSKDVAAQTQQVENGLQITCNQTQANYRSDLKHNAFGDYNNNSEVYYDLDADKYKVFAIKFIGERPTSGVLKLQNIAVNDSWIANSADYSLSPQGYTDLTDADGNHIYYWTIGGTKWTGTLTITKMEIVIADIKSDNDKTFTVSELNWFENADALMDAYNIESPVYNATTHGHYKDLTTAWASIADGDVLVVNTDQTTNDCLSVPNDVAVTVRGAEGKNITITRGNTNAMMFLANKGGTCKLTLENLTLDGNSTTATNYNLIEASSNSTVTYNNVAIKNAKSSNAIGLIVAKSNGKVAINGLSFDENCETLDNNSRLVFIGAAGSSISGNNQLTMTIENTHNVDVTAELTNESPIAVKSYNNSFVSGNKVFTGSTATSKFSLVGVDGLRLLAKDGNIVFSDQEGIALRNADEYADFMTAWNDAQSGDVVTLKGDVSVAGTLNGNKRNITLRGNKAAAKVIRKDADGSETTDNESTAVTITRTGTGLLILANQGETVTVEDVVIDGGNLESTNNLIEASGNSTVALSDVTVQSAKSSNSLGLLVAKGSGTLALTDVATTDCTVNESTGTVFVGRNSTVTLAGDNQISISGEHNSTIVDDGMTNSSKIDLYVYGTDTTSKIKIEKTDNASSDTASKFNVVTDSYDVAVDESGKITVAYETPAGIANVEVDAADAPVEYYNLQGQRVANPTNGVFLRKQGATVTKVRI
jgi:hypothetical protein